MGQQPGFTAEKSLSVRRRRYHNVKAYRTPMPAGALPASWVQMSQAAGDPAVLDGADPGTEQEQNGDDTGDGGVDAGSATIVSEELEEDGSLDDDGEAAEAGGVEGGAELAGGVEGGAELTG